MDAYAAFFGPAGVGKTSIINTLDSSIEGEIIQLLEARPADTHVTENMAVVPMVPSSAPTDLGTLFMIDTKGCENLHECDVEMVLGHHFRQGFEFSEVLIVNAVCPSNSTNILTPQENLAKVRREMETLDTLTGEERQAIMKDKLAMLEKMLPNFMADVPPGQRVELAVFVITASTEKADSDAQMVFSVARRMSECGYEMAPQLFLNTSMPYSKTFAACCWSPLLTRCLR